MSDPHAQMIEAALKAWFWDMEWPTGNAKLDARHRSDCRRALAAAFRAWEPSEWAETQACEYPPGWNNLKAAADVTAAELDGQSDGGQAAS